MALAVPQMQQDKRWAFAPEGIIAGQQALRKTSLGFQYR